MDLTEFSIGHNSVVLIVTDELCRTRADPKIFQDNNRCLVELEGLEMALSQN